MRRKLIIYSKTNLIHPKNINNNKANMKNN